MSGELARARKQLSQIRTMLKDEKYVPAAQALQSGIATMLQSQLLKSERDEFETLLATAVSYFANNDYIRKHAAIILTYAPGQERMLHDLIKEIANDLNEAALAQAQEQIRLRATQRQEKFDRGVEALDAGKLEMGQTILSELVQEYPEEPELRGSVGERLLRAGLYELAVKYLTEAIDQKPDMLPFYNSIGIALRRLNRFDVAETYYLRASKYLRLDPNLYFNLGRLYVDWQKWDKAIKSAQIALKLNPEFVEAQKMLDYAAEKQSHL